MCVPVCVCFRPPTLCTLEDLDDTMFGLSSPEHHGRRLLSWFLNRSQHYNDNLHTFCNLEDEGFGFHLFKNIEKLLPYGFKYYTLGNLNKKKARYLPRYIREYYTGNHDESNVDRIIVGIDYYGYIRSVYVTEHYDSNATYQISHDLCMEIRSQLWWWAYEFYQANTLPWLPYVWVTHNHHLQLH